jgi:hypothetical protein
MCAWISAFSSPQAPDWNYKYFILNFIKKPVFRLLNHRRDRAMTMPVCFQAIDDCQQGLG